MAVSHKIVPHLWFDNQAEEASKFYTSIFKNSRIIRKSHYGKEGFDLHRRPEGSVMTVEFEIEGQLVVALNGGPDFKFNEAVSLMVNCANQQEIDYYWERLSAGGDPAAQQCGWLKDKFGLSWQIVPVALAAMVSDPNRERSERVIKAMLKMKKLELDVLTEAWGHSLVN
jgi:predicted 3-demethylubiquinone-9 3-methyltransferase (glyoxalase superfamily)